ncbi:branched-chain amino acid ABC transporter ATP-binding protein/permease [Grimontia marina]|uniref:High-affinity branched-chain amino acid transport ATP-binding protein LivF n=1 Tax=Grimontia marina TaxID=646534 RepID=A0A128F7L4_9GAMM|nr:ATP-binding cassette domain-containing protein [Grimontia marina]CZF82728.1 High-affinity branched-chain amino acid transport ATP-binding protein LivF [Grimontia marina]
MASFHNVNFYALAFIFALPLFIDSFTAYEVGLYLIFGLAALSVASCWGQAGFLPLGQAAFFGLGAYLYGYVNVEQASVFSVVEGLFLALLVPALLSFALGKLVFSRTSSSGPYFSLITLAVAMLATQLALVFDGVTGGFNGLNGINDIPGTDRYENLYWVIAGAVAVVLLSLQYLENTPFGLLLNAIRDNEQRVDLLGYKSDQLKSIVFAISAAVSGLAGALYSVHQGIVTPQALGFFLSAEFVIWAAVGGRFTLVGPIAGALVMGMVSSELKASFPYWEVIVASIFIVVVLFLPKGLLGWLPSTKTRIEDDKIEEDTGSCPLERRVSLTVNDVSVSIGAVNILTSLEMRLGGQGIQCLIGPNGAGKTSAFNTMTGALPLSSGNLLWNGERFHPRKPYDAARQGIGRKLQIPCVFSSLSVEENIHLAMWASRSNKKSLFRVAKYGKRSASLNALYEAMPFLEQGEVLAGSLSVGQRQMLDFTMTCLAEPDLLLLDEPCAGLSPVETKTLIDIIKNYIARERKPCVIIEHDMQVVEKLADEVLVMNQGSMLCFGSFDFVRENEEVRAIYAGGTK